MQGGRNHGRIRLARLRAARRADRRRDGRSEARKRGSWKASPARMRLSAMNSGTKTTQPPADQRPVPAVVSMQPSVPQPLMSTKSEPRRLVMSPVAA